MQHFDDYQLFTDTTAIYPQDIGLPYTTLGLVGEIGEYTEKILGLTKNRSHVVPNFEQIAPYEEFKEILEMAADLGRKAEELKKSLRKGKKQMPRIIVWSADERDELIKELGDIQHYTARNARHLQVDLSHVAYENIKKISDRQRRGVVEGEGDNR